MQNYYEKLIEEYNKQNPGALPENAAANMPPDVAQELASRIPATPAESPYDVHVSDNTVTQDGKLDTTIPSVPTPADDIVLPEPPVDAAAPAPALPPIADKTPAKAEPKIDPAAITAATPDPIPVRGKRNPLPILAAGAGDAISAAASAFGGNAPGGSAQREADYQDKEIDKQQTEQEDAIKANPNSAVSKNYRQMVLQMVPDLGKNPDFANMSAKMIGDKLPMIDTMMKAQSQKDMKELGLKQIQAQKDMAASQHNDQMQGKYEKEGRDVVLKQLSNRSGGLGLQDSKVNQAIDLRQMINQNYDPKTDTYNIPPALHSELVLGLARLISPNGQIGIQMEQELKTKTAKEGLAKAFTYLTGVPMSGAPQAVIKMFVHSIDRQGETAEALRDKYNQQLRQMMPTQLNDDVKTKLMQQEMGSKFTDYKNPKKATSKPGQVSKSDPLGLGL